MPSSNVRRRPVLLAQALPVALALALSLALPALGPLARADAPPPIPSLELRSRLIAAEQEAWEGEPLPGAWEWEPGETEPLPAPPRAVHDEYDVTHYDISLGLDIPSHVIHGTVELQATARVANLAQVNLDLYACMTVDQVTVNGSPAPWVHPGGLLTVDLDHAYQVGEAFTVACAYHGTPSYSGTPFRWNSQNGEPMVLSYSEPYGAPAWWLCKDDPKDKATFALHITVPDTLYAVSNGALTGVADNGDGTASFTWETQYPMSTYLFSIAVTGYSIWTEDYTALDGVTTMPVRYHAYRADSTRARESWGRNIGMMEYFASLFGEYPFLEEKYGIAEFAHPGAMEHQTCTSMGSSWITGDDSNDFVVAHELSHSWVGDMITMTTYSHAWCKEGFATYCEALYFEDLYGEDYYHEYMASIPGLTYGLYRIYNMNPPLHAAIYYKGAWVLHMLRHVIGDEAFFDAVYAYTNDPDYRYGVADTEDLREAFEEASGMDLVWFFTQWVYQPGYPVYQTHWWPEETEDGYDVHLTLSQTQSAGPTFKMPIDVRVATLSGRQTFVVWDSLRTQDFTLHVDSQPTGLDVDPEVWVLRVIEAMSGVGADEPVIAALARNRPNPFGDATWIGFDLAAGGRAQLDIYDAAGRWVTRLLDGVQPAGASGAFWDGTDRRGHAVAAGSYYYRLRAGDGVRSGRMLLVR